MSEKILMPRPVLRDGDGKLTADYLDWDWIYKLYEEVAEVADADCVISQVHELVDVIAVCVSFLFQIYSRDPQNESFPDFLSNIIADVNEKNEKRGYFLEN